MNSRSLSSAYNAFYYSHNCGRPYQRDEEWLGFFGSIADRIVRDIGPGTALDAGCAMGFLVETLRARGVAAVGMDISEYAIENVHQDVRPYCSVGSITEPLPRRYDLIVCIEVLEHLSPLEADQAIANLCQHADDILFSSTPYDYKEATHLNVRPPDYWAQKFALHGCFRDVDFDGSFITPWTIRFRKTDEPAWRIVYGYERRHWQLEKEIEARRQLTIEQQRLLAEQTQAEQAHTQAQAQQQATINELTAALQQAQEQAQQLQAQTAARQETIDQLTAQLRARQETLDSVATRQSALEATLAQLLDTRSTIDALIAQVTALNAALAESQQQTRQLEVQLAQAESSLKVYAMRQESDLAALATLQAESAQTIAALTKELTDKEQLIRTQMSRAKGAELTIKALTQQRQEFEQALGAQAQAVEEVAAQSAARAQEIEKLMAVLTERTAKLADVNSSLVWYIYNRLKYPYLLFLFRLYEQIKYPYLLAIYRRLGLAARQLPPPAAPPFEPPAPPPAPGPLLSPAPFPVSEVAPPPAVPPHHASIDVIICIHNALADVQLCLASVIYHTRMPYALILVDDGSDAETRDYLVAFARAQGATLIRNETAKGYTFAANQGLRRAQGDYALLLNSDTVVTPLWLDRLIACGESDPHIGLVGPLSNAASWQSVPELMRDGDFAANELPAGMTVGEMGKTVGQYAARLYPRIPFLNGFCLLIKRSVIAQLGYFDEATFGKGYGEENDYCLRARKAGWQLALADDAYVYHAQSRSYSHERRRELSQHADRALAAKHEPQLIWQGVTVCRADRVLQGIRARSRTMLERQQLLAAGMQRWEGKRVLFILTIRSACGGGNVVLDEADAMRRMGVNARLINLTRNREAFERSYPENTVPVLYVDDEDQIADVSADYDAVIATANDTVYWLKPAVGAAQQPVKAYYVQDFEPYFSRPDAPGFRIAWNSYTAHPDLIRFTKTEWNRVTVRENTGADCAVVGPSLNLDLYRPRSRRDPDWPQRPLRIAALIRPSTPRRNPQLTMEVLGALQRQHGATIEIVLFGCESADPEFLALPHDFDWRNAGMLTRPQTASLLNEIDIFVDFSEFQAMGLTAMEAMACGAAVIVPARGGADSFAKHDENALIVDTGAQVNCLEALERLVMDETLRARLQQQALIDACQFYPERAAYNTLQTLFPAAGEANR